MYPRWRLVHHRIVVLGLHLKDSLGELDHPFSELQVSIDVELSVGVELESLVTYRTLLLGVDLKLNLKDVKNFLVNVNRRLSESCSTVFLGSHFSGL